MNPAQWEAATWIAAAGTFGGFVLWMTSLWVRAGRILEKIDSFAKTQDDHGERIVKAETNLIKLNTALGME